MSLESARSFLEKMRTDKGFEERISAYKTPEDLLKAVADAGFEFTAAEIKSAGEELSDADLESIAGGSSNIFFMFTNQPLIF